MEEFHFRIVILLYLKVCDDCSFSFLILDLPKLHTISFDDDYSLQGDDLDIRVEYELHSMSLGVIIFPFDPCSSFHATVCCANLPRICFGVDGCTSINNTNLCNPFIDETLVLGALFINFMGGDNRDNRKTIINGHESYDNTLIMKSK